MEKMRVAIIGQGRSGRNIHGKFFESADNNLAKVVCVAEPDELRRKRAAEDFGCDTVSDYRELFLRNDIDLIVNSTYSNDHYAITKDIILHGKNVLTEKPMGRTYFECAELIRLAKEKGVVFAVFHQSLLSPAFLNVKNVIASGKIGDVYQINVRYSSFARRWDWQTLQSRCAGGLYNTGPHPVGQALDLIGWDENARVAFSSLNKALTSGDSDDCAKIIIEAPNKPIVDIEVNSADAFASDYIFKIFGTKGTLISTNGEYKIKYIDDFSKYPERPVQRDFISDEDGRPVYCSEKLEFTEESDKIHGTAFDAAVLAFYQMLWDAVMEGKPLTVTPEMAARVISVIETCHAQNPLPVQYD